MGSKYLMISSSLVLGVVGAIFTFMPEEISHLLTLEINIIIILTLQLTGALYIGFATLNWMARGNIIGGVYSKPLAMGNFANFFVGGMTLIKFVLSNPDLTVLWAAAIIYSIFAVWFGIIMFRHPAS